MTRPTGRRIRIASLKHHVASFMSGLGVNCECCLLLIVPIPSTLEAAIAAADEHAAKHRAAPGGRLPMYPWSDGTRRPADPTHGQHSHRVQWHVEQLQPTDRGQRAALERTITDRLAVLGDEAALLPLKAEAWSLPEEEA